MKRHTALEETSSDCPCKHLVQYAMCTGKQVCLLGVGSISTGTRVWRGEMPVLMVATTSDF